MRTRKLRPARSWDLEEQLLHRSLQVIWQQPVDNFYTDHGVGHSERVAILGETLGRIYRISSFERHLLRQAAYLHDIGMQFDFWGKQDATQGETIAGALSLPHPPLGAGKVRARHVELGLSLAQAEINNRRFWTAIPPFSSGASEDRNALHQASLVAFAHSKGPTWDSFCRPNPALGSKQDPFQAPLRLRLLAGIFRLADELDGNRLRVPRIDQIFESDLSIESRRHWLACFFVDAVNVEDHASSGICIHVRWRVPMKVEADVRKAIRAFLLEWRCRRIAETITEVNQMYISGGEGGFSRHIFTQGLEDEPTDFPMEVDDRLRELLGIEINRADARGPRQPRQGKPAVQPVPLSTPVATALEEWFYTNHRQGHFELNRGFHTDTLVQCRSWISNRRLLRAIRSAVIEQLDRVAAPDLIVGVGTSAIPIAVEVALLLDARVSFTFGQPPAQVADEIPRHPEWEVRPVVEGSERRILIIDDIISFGDIACEVIGQLSARIQAASGREPSIIHCAVLRLGAERLRTVPGVRYFQLCHLPNIRYRRSEEECEQCREGHPIIREWDL